MKKTYLYTLVSLFTFAVFSCDNREDDKFSIKLNKNSVTLEVVGGEQSVTVVANGEWEISGIPEWISINPTYGNYNADITITATENKELARREATIIFSRENVKKTLIIKQLGLSDLDPFIELDKSQLTINVLGDEQKIELTTNTAWTATDVPDWITLDHTSSDKSAQITIRVGMNENPEGRQTSLVFTNKDGNIKKRLNVYQNGHKDYITGPSLPIFRFKEVSFTTALTHYDILVKTLFINSSIKNKIYLGNLLSHNAQSNTNIPEFTGYTFNPITISTSAPIAGEVSKTYLPSWAEQDAFAKKIIEKKPSLNTDFIADNGTTEFYTYKQLHTIGVANLGEKLDEVISGASYIDKEMASGYGFIYSFKQTLFTLEMDNPDKLIKEELKEADKTKGVSYVTSVSYGRIGLLIVESYSQKIKNAINKVITDKALSQEETNLIQLATISYVYYDNDKRLRTLIGNLDVVKEYKKAILDTGMSNIYPLEFGLINYSNNSPSDISFSFDVPKK